VIRFSAEDRVLVTGASSGLGAASAVLLNRLGAGVIGVGRDAARLETVRNQCAHPHNFYPEAQDLTANLDALVPWMKSLRERYGKMRGLLHCAGILSVKPLSLQTPQSVKELFEINFFAACQIARAFLDRRNNAGEQSSVVFMASVAALQGEAGLCAYAASKGAVISLMRSLADEFAGQGIRVNAISPALIATPMTQSPAGKSYEMMMREYPLGPGRAEDIAYTAAFLLSSAARWITGQNIVVDGGRSLAGGESHV
jgi:NAD(P)-dependent dehydrogenase (short-subunit alcohol dehydrogenase family)